MGSGQNVLNYVEQGGARSVIGGSLDVVPGGEIDIEAGGAFKIAGTDKAAALAAAILTPIAGVAAGYKVARGVATIDAASKDIVTGLATVVAAVVSMVGDPSMTHMYSSVTVGDQAGAPAAGSIRIKSWKPTAANDCTPIAAADVFGNVSWIAIGT